VTHLCRERAHWSLGIRGNEFAQTDGDRLLALLRAEGQNARERQGLDAKEPSPLRVMVRADEAALYEVVQQALSGCAESGIWKVELAAAIGGE
jgi:biopolymer transport protein ExbD